VGRVAERGSTFTSSYSLSFSFYCLLLLLVPLLLCGLSVALKKSVQLETFTDFGD
jgi:hypothetical protein